MKRDIEQFLLSWKADTNRKPLLVRGARQVGKSHSIEQFGKQSFGSTVTINFELEPRFAACFQHSLDPSAILGALSVLSGQTIVPGTTLLFLDEVQLCPRAIMALRYLHEQRHDLHVIAAGSLLEFTLELEQFRMPVGRVEYAHAYPMTFGEFLDAAGEEPARQSLGTCSLDHPPSQPVHSHLLDLVRTYCLVGGMPEAVAQYAQSRDISRAQRVRLSLAQTYRDDFSKYATHAHLPHLQQLFAAAKAVGRKFRYAEVDRETQSRELRHALLLLEKAGVVRRIRQTSGAGLPLGAEASERNFKVLMMDVGLMQSMCGAGPDLLAARDVLAVHAGAVAEQYVGQELLALGGTLAEPGLYYWSREAPSSSAEVDYLLAHGTTVLPVEVKAGSTGSLRSMHLFLDQYRVPFGVRLSAHPLAFDGRVLSVPLYLVDQLPRLLQSL
jgi:predicted AAA+ superfamily ATPase